MVKIINNIFSYIEFITTTYNLSVSVHDNVGFLSQCRYKLVPYNIHSNPYCLYVKSNKNVWDKCISRQHKVFKKCKDGIFFGTCYAGVGEFVVPIINNDTVLGFISISGYKSNCKDLQQKFEYISKEYYLNKNNLIKIYDEYLYEPLAMDFIKTIITPLSCMFELLYLQNEKVYINANENSDYIYSHVLAYINQNYSQKIRLDDISKACHCSNSYISHLFQKRNGVNISKYINSVRLKEAQRMLLQTELSIQEIAYLTGFSDSNYFTNTFKSEYKISPRKFRKKFKEV